MDILIMAIEGGRFGPARLPQALAKAGLSVAALCHSDNILAHSRFLSRRYTLPTARAAGRLARALAAAIADCQPSLLIPADEQTVVLLQSLVHGRHAKLLPESARSLVVRSLGNPLHFDAMLLKSATLSVARGLGIAVPPGRTVASAEDAVCAAREIGYPVFVKHSFSWAGQGVARCENDAQVRAAHGKPRGLVAGIKTRLRHLLGRDWFPEHSPVDVQGGIAGDPAFYCALAWEGRMVSGYAGKALELAYANGPSIAVQLSQHQQMAEIAEKMIAALDCTGFVSFDFMTRDGQVLLIECNPRPVPVSHLGSVIGVDHAVELAKLLRGSAPSAAPLATTAQVDVLLFPHALDKSHARPGRMADVPWEDTGLIHFVDRAAPAARAAIAPGVPLAA